MPPPEAEHAGAGGHRRHDREGGPGRVAPVEQQPGAERAEGSGPGQPRGAHPEEAAPDPRGHQVSHPGAPGVRAHDGQHARGHGDRDEHAERDLGGDAQGGHERHRRPDHAGEGEGHDGEPSAVHPARPPARGQVHDLRGDRNRAERADGGGVRAQVEGPAGDHRAGRAGHEDLRHRALGDVGPERAASLDALRPGRRGRGRRRQRGGREEAGPHDGPGLGDTRQRREQPVRQRRDPRVGR